MSFLRCFASYYRRNLFSGASWDCSSHLNVAQRCHLLTVLDQRRYLSSADQPDGTEISNAPGENKGSTTPPPSSGGPPIFTWAKWAIGSILTLLLPFLYAQWKTLQKIEVQIDTAKEAVEKTAAVVEKVAEMAEKASKEVADELKDGKLKEAAEVVEKISKIVEEDARRVEDIIHKVDDIEEDVKSIVEPIIDQSKHDDKKKQEENKLQDQLN